MLIRKKTDWSIRAATPIDYDGLSDFIGQNAWAGASNHRAQFRWKYEAAGVPETLALIATNTEQQIVASSMFMPWTFSLNGQPLPASQWGDLFLALEYRGQSIADLTLQQGLALGRQAGRPVCFAFPNAHSVPIHKKNKGHHLGHLVRYAKPLRSSYLVQRKVSNALAVKVLSSVIDVGLTLLSKETYQATAAVQPVDACGAAFDEVWQRFSDSNPDLVVTRKDAAYLTWKYLESPARVRRLFAYQNGDRVDGWVVVEADAECGYIIDVLATSDAVLRALIAFAVKTFRREGCQSAAFVALDNNRYFPVFRRLGFGPRPDVKHLYVYLDDTLPNLDLLKDSNHWFITAGDCDIERM